MAKVIYKNKVGALHIGGGRFFYANEPVVVSEEEKDQLLAKYGEDLEEVLTPELHTKATLKKLNKEQQEAIISQFGGDPVTPRNEEERIALILDLQEKKAEE
jgi:hypothetical protein